MATEIKKTSHGYEIDGITYDKLSDAEDHKKELDAGNVGDRPSWADEKIEYAFRSETASTFAVFVTEFLEKTSMTISSFASGVGVTRKAVYDWMAAKTIPEDKHIEMIAAFTKESTKDVRLALFDNFRSKNQGYFEAISLSDVESEALLVMLRREKSSENAKLEVMIKALLSLKDEKEKFAFSRAMSKLRSEEKNVNGIHALQKIEVLMKTV